MILFSVLCSIVYAIFCVFLCLPLSSFFCDKKHLLCSSERCFVYYIKIQATESFEISQKSILSHSYVHPAFFHYDLHVFIVTIFRSFSSRTPGKFQVFFQKKYCCPLRSTGQLSFRTPCFFRVFVIPNTMYFFTCREIVTNIFSWKS